MGHNETTLVEYLVALQAVEKRLDLATELGRLAVQTPRSEDLSDGQLYGGERVGNPPGEVADQEGA